MPPKVDASMGFFSAQNSKAGKFSSSKKLGPFDDIKSFGPGPGGYIFPDTTNTQKGPCLGRAPRFPKSPTTSTPGPRIIDCSPAEPRSKTIAISRAPRTPPVKDTNCSPGPCGYAYDQSTMSKQGGKLDRSKKEPSFLPPQTSASPGPCAYTPPDFGPRVPTVFMGKQAKSLEWPKTAGPGPGGYNIVDSSDFPPKRKAPLGKSERNIDFGKKDVTPGPGAYNPNYTLDSGFTKL